MGFKCEAICFRRLRKLTEGGLLERKRILYGVPSLYTLTSRSRRLIGASNYAPKIRLEQIHHDALTLDLMIAYTMKKRVAYKDVLSPRDINAADGFGGSRHTPDFVLPAGRERIAFEVELTLKTKDRLFKNIQANFNNYDLQVWLISQHNRKLIDYLAEASIMYPLEVYYLEELGAKICP
jgi:hypothetical protein